MKLKNYILVLIGGFIVGLFWPLKSQHLFPYLWIGVSIGITIIAIASWKELRGTLRQ